VDVRKKFSEINWATAKKELGEGMEGFITAPYDVLKFVIERSRSKFRNRNDSESSINRLLK
jgi:hypothetical protein